MESTITPQLATSSSDGIVRYPFLDFSYWFATPNPGSLNHWPILTLVVLSSLILGLALVLIGLKLLSSKLQPPQQKFLTKIAWFLLPLGLLGWFFVGVRLLGVVFLSARFWWILWFLGILLSSFWLYREARKIPARKAQYQTYQLKKRYFPKKKKR